ncbi:hypothetical protein RB195_008361 [Necator americanus]|uniref:Uncharacterized protein n=1 Tax=Necator americanus TaxID=51031 RepID=A0ABR1CP63_NECAM
MAFFLSVDYDFPLTVFYGAVEKRKGIICGFARRISRTIPGLRREGEDFCDRVNLLERLRTYVRIQLYSIFVGV